MVPRNTTTVHQYTGTPTIHWHSSTQAATTKRPWAINDPINPFRSALTFAGRNHMEKLRGVFFRGRIYSPLIARVGTILKVLRAKALRYHTNTPNCGLPFINKILKNNNNRCEIENVVETHLFLQKLCVVLRSSVLLVLNVLMPAVQVRIYTHTSYTSIFGGGKC